MPITKFFIEMATEYSKRATETLEGDADFKPIFAELGKLVKTDGVKYFKDSIAVLIKHFKDDSKLVALLNKIHERYAKNNDDLTEYNIGQLNSLLLKSIYLDKVSKKHSVTDSLSKNELNCFGGTITRLESAINRLSSPNVSAFEVSMNQVVSALCKSKGLVSLDGEDQAGSLEAHLPAFMKVCFGIDSLDKAKQKDNNVSFPSFISASMMFTARDMVYQNLYEMRHDYAKQALINMITDKKDGGITYKALKTSGLYPMLMKDVSYFIKTDDSLKEISLFAVGEKGQIIWNQDFITALNSGTLFDVNMESIDKTGDLFRSLTLAIKQDPYDGFIREKLKGLPPRHTFKTYRDLQFLSNEQLKELPYIELEQAFLILKNAANISSVGTNYALQERLFNVLSEVDLALYNKTKGAEGALIREGDLALHKEIKSTEIEFNKEKVIEKYRSYFKNENGANCPNVRQGGKLDSFYKNLGMVISNFIGERFFNSNFQNICEDISDHNKVTLITSSVFNAIRAAELSREKDKLTEAIKAIPNTEGVRKGILKNIIPMLWTNEQLDLICADITQYNNYDKYAELLPYSKEILLKGSELNNVELVNALIEAETNKDTANTNDQTALALMLTAQDRDGNTALMLAVREGNTGIVSALIKAGADINEVNQDGDTPLALAVCHGQTDVVKELIKAGADITIADKDGDTPLRLAALMGYDEIVKELIKAGADINQVDGAGDTPLILAAYNGRTGVVKELIKAGVKLDQINMCGQDALAIANKYGFLDIKKELLNAIKLDNRVDAPQNTKNKKKKAALSSESTKKFIKDASSSAREVYELYNKSPNKFNAVVNRDTLELMTNLKIDLNQVLKLYEESPDKLEFFKKKYKKIASFIDNGKISYADVSDLYDAYPGKIKFVMKHADYILEMNIFDYSLSLYDDYGDKLSDIFNENIQKFMKTFSIPLKDVLSIYIKSPGKLQFLASDGMLDFINVTGVPCTKIMEIANKNMDKLEAVTTIDVKRLIADKELSFVQVCRTYDKNPSDLKIISSKKSRGKSPSEFKKIPQEELQQQPVTMSSVFKELQSKTQSYFAASTKANRGCFADNQNANRAKNDLVSKVTSDVYKQLNTVFEEYIKGTGVEINAYNLKSCAEGFMKKYNEPSTKDGNNKKVENKTKIQLSEAIVYLDARLAVGMTKEAATAIRGRGDC